MIYILRPWPSLLCCAWHYQAMQRLYSSGTIIEFSITEHITLSFQDGHASIRGHAKGTSESDQATGYA